VIAALSAEGVRGLAAAIERGLASDGPTVIGWSTLDRA
jgi:hypothetical protein